MNFIEYEILNKKEVISGFINGYISEDFYDNYFYVELINGATGITNPLKDVLFIDIIESINNDNVVFIHKSIKKKG